MTPIYLPGILPGCSKYVRDISELLAQRGHTVTVVTADAITGRGWVDPLFGRYAGKNQEVIDGVHVRRLRTRWYLTSILYLTGRTAGSLMPSRLRDKVSLLSAGPYPAGLREEFDRAGYEAIHVTAFPFAIVWLVWKACQALRKPFVCTPLIHFEDPRHRNPILWRVLGDASAVIACSSFEKEGMVHMGIHPRKIHVIPMSINLAEWKNPDGERFRRKHHLEGRTLALFTGTKDYNKGAVHVLRAVDQLAEKVKDLTLVSMGLATPEWRETLRRLPQIPLLDLGYATEEEKQDAFDACDLFVMPSRYDSFGIVYLEAWRCGKPVIGARVGAIPEVIEDGRDGLLVEFGNLEQLASAILSLVQNPELRASLGESGKKKVIERFNWKDNIGKVEEVFREARG